MPSNSRPTQLTETVLHSTGAYELVFSALLLGLIGYGLDRWFGTQPIFVVTLSVLGFIGAGFSLYYRYKALSADLARERT